MSKSVLDSIGEFLKPQAPFWACELTSKHVIVAGVDGKRRRIEGRVASELPAGGLNGSLAEANIANADAIRANVKDALIRAGFQGSEIGLVIPDEAARIAFLTADKLPKDPKEQLTFIRWKLKKTVPFDIDTAQIAHKVLGLHFSNGVATGTGVELVAAVSPRFIIQEYEQLMDGLDLHAGFILPSTIAALNLYQAPPGDSLFVKIAPDCVTTSIFQARRLAFYRRVAGAAVYDAVYPTILYYQDKLQGTAIQQLTVCGYDDHRRDAIVELEQKLNLSTQRLQPASVDDIYKPALGSVHASWQSLI